MDDRSVVELQIGRAPRSDVVVSARCHLELPVVTDVPPILDDGTPFPTTHWLTCPLATLRLSRLESDGGIKRFDDRIAEEPEFREAFDGAMERYRTARDAQIPSDWTGPRPSGGVAGSHGGVKCLHAHYADTAAGNDNPVGLEAAVAIEPLDCLVPCVITVDGVVTLNPEWSEPA